MLQQKILNGLPAAFFILEGTGMVEVGGQAAQPVAPGDVVTIAPRCPQRISNPGTVDLVFFAVCTPRCC